MSLSPKMTHSKTNQNKEDRQFTFKIIKRRSPWTQSEDNAIIALVQKHGTGNWTIISNEMSSKYNFKNRSGKQCRERWHNHLDPNVNKNYWDEKEEAICSFNWRRNRLQLCFSHVGHLPNTVYRHHHRKRHGFLP